MLPALIKENSSTVSRIMTHIRRLLGSRGRPRLGVIFMLIMVYANRQKSTGNVISLLDSFHYFIRDCARHYVSVTAANRVFKRLVPDSIHVCRRHQRRVGLDGDGLARKQFTKS